MTRDEALKGVAAVLASLSQAEANEIDPTNKIKTFVPPQNVMALALAVDKAFPKVDLTDLMNDLYDPISTVGQLVDRVMEAYSR